MWFPKPGMEGCNCENCMIDLIDACQKGTLEDVQQKIEEGFCVNRARQGWTPLVVAARRGELPIVKLLIKNGEDIDHNTDGETPLMSACQQGHLDIAKTLIVMDASVNPVTTVHDKEGLSPLLLACFNGHLEVAKFLIVEGAQISKCDINGESSLHMASEMGHWKIVKILIEEGALVNHIDDKGRSALHLACENGHLETVKVLITHNANFLYKNDSDAGKTALDVAKTQEIIDFIHKEIFWSRRRPMIVTRPHDDHDTNEIHKLKPLGELITAIKSDNPNSEDDVLFQIKIKIASFL